MKSPNSCDAPLYFRDFNFTVDQSRFERQQTPLAEIRLMVVDVESGSITHDFFKNLPSYFSSKDVLVSNRCGIAPSRLKGVSSSGVCVDICFLLQTDKNSFSWEVVVLFEDSKDVIENGTFSLADGLITGSLQRKTQDFDASYWVEKNRYSGYRGIVELDQSPIELREILDRTGMLMTPWYTDLNVLLPEDINPFGVTEPSPHISEPARRISQKMFTEFEANGTKLLHISLAVSFSWKPTKPDIRLTDYEMNPEEFSVSPKVIEELESLLKNGKRVTSIGTSGVRALESLGTPPKPVRACTDLFISPGFNFRYVDSLVTHFHNPMGTHIVMAAAFSGLDLIMHAYQIALQEGYYFGIHGDAMLIIGRMRDSSTNGA